MTIEQVKKKLVELSEKDDREVYENVSYEDYNQIIDLLINYLPINDLKTPVGKFLYYSAWKFDKFNVPSLYAYSDKEYDIFCRSLEALKQQEGLNSQNTPLLELHKIKWDFYNKNSLKVLSINDVIEIKALCINIEKMSVTHLSEMKLNEFTDFRNDLLLLLNGVLDKSIRTEIKTRLPYKFSNHSLISLNIEGIDIEVSIIPQVFDSKSSFFQVEGEVQVVQNEVTRWQSSMSEIEITIKGFIDDSKEVSPLILNVNPKSSLKNWNSLYEFTYKLIEKLWWYFVETDVETSDWIPIPKDIPFVSYNQMVNEKQIGFNLASNPSNTYTISSSINSDLQKIEIEQLVELKWSKKCSVYAKKYLELGQFQEGLFWLNVATESLIEEFIVKIVDDEDRYNRLFSSVPVFESAEEILSEQFSEMKGKVKWPEVTKHPSVFNLIKILFKEYPFEISKKDVLKNFSIINSKRNLLFHGSNVSIGGEEIDKAYKSYQWLEDNLN